MKTLHELAREYWTAEESRDVQRILSFFTHDALWTGPGAAHLRGHQEIATFYEENGRKFPGLRVEVGRVFGGPTEAAVEWHAVLTDTDGNDLAVSGVNLMERQANRFSRLEAFFDPSGF